MAMRLMNSVLNEKRRAFKEVHVHVFGDTFPFLTDLSILPCSTNSSFSAHRSKHPAWGAGGRCPDTASSSLTTADGPVGGTPDPDRLRTQADLALYGKAWCTEDWGQSETHSLAFERKSTPGRWHLKSQSTHLGNEKIACLTQLSQK